MNARTETAADSPDFGGSAGESAPSLAIAVAELRDAQIELDAALAGWSNYSPSEGAEVAARWWRARGQLRDAIAGES